METKKKQSRQSINPRNVARDVIAAIERGENVKFAPILRKHGYAPSVVASPQVVTERVGYKEEIASYVQRLEKERVRVLAAMEEKDLTDEQYRTLADAQTKMTHDVQLLSGGKTENVGMEDDRKTLKAIVAAIQLEQ